MKLDDSINFRVTHKEHEYYNRRAEECNMSCSEWIRTRLNDDYKYSEFASELVKNIARMQTYINQAISGFEVNRNLDNLLNEVNDLCRF